MNASLNVVTLGEGKDDLVLLHGWGRSLESMRSLGDILTSDFTVHLIDLPGFGASPEPDTAWDSFDYARIIKEYLDSKEITKAHFVGHSFGGKVSLSMASLFPSYVDHLVVMGSSGIRPHRSLVKKLRLKAIKYTSRFVDRYFKTSLRDRWGSTDYRNASGVMRSILVRAVNDDLSAALPNVEVPALLLWGEEDGEAPLSSGKKMAKLLPHAHLIQFPHKGHDLITAISAHLMGRHILKFLRAPC